MNLAPSFLASALRLVVLAILLAVVAGGARASASSDLALLLDADDEAEQRLYPSFGVQRGDERYLNAYEEDLTQAHLDQRRRRNAEETVRLSLIARAQLSRQEQLSYDILQWKLEDERRALVPMIARMRQELPLNQFSGAHLAFAREMQWRSDFPFTSARDYERTISRMEGFSRWIDQAIINMRDGAARGVVLPKIVVERMLPEFDRLTDPDLERSIFVGPVRNMPITIIEPERSRIDAAYRQTVATNLLPAYRRLSEFFRSEYLAAARESVGLGAMPGGKELYLYFVHNQTNEEVSPDEIHALGLSEISRIEREMEVVKSTLGFSGTLAEFHSTLRADVRFRFRDAAAQLAAFERAHATIMTRLGTQFRTRPNARLEFRAIEDYAAPSRAAAEYSAPSADGRRPGLVYINSFDLASRPRYAVAALVLHEGVPGHHLQLALAVENTAIPDFRRHGTWTAFTEGWALYAESLGPELGLYTDPYERFGALSFDAWRACRLVVDTGIHWFGWSRERAIAYLLEHTALSETDARAEVERYIALPAQALAYKIGQRKFLELKTRARTVLGAKFDVRDFHDALLADGAMPLPILEAKMERWVQEQAR